MGVWWSVATTVLGCVGFGGIVSGVMLRRIDRMNAQEKDRADRRVKEDVLTMRGVLAVGKLARATADAVKTGKANGEVTSAEKVYDKWEQDAELYLMQQSAERNVL